MFDVFAHVDNLTREALAEGDRKLKSVRGDGQGRYQPISNSETPGSSPLFQFGVPPPIHMAQPQPQPQPQPQAKQTHQRSKTSPEERPSTNGAELPKLRKKLRTKRDVEFADSDTVVLTGDMHDYFGKHRIPIFVCPPFSYSRFMYGPKWLVLWLLPMLCAGLAFFLQNFQLRVGTYYYVHKMMQVDLRRNYTRPIFPGPNDVPLTVGRFPQDVSFGSLQDTVTGQLGAYSKVNISFLDMMALVFPFSFVVLVVSMDYPYVWTRIMTCFSILALGKGLFAWITVEPDSNGWQACQDRLASSKVSMDWYAQKHSLWDLLTADPRSRLCADMMWSGHTYFVTLFALGLHECTRLAMRASVAWKRILAESIVAFLAILQQSLEIYFVLKSRFHYTADVVMAVFVTFLLYTNGSIAVMVQKWLTPSPDQVKKDFVRMRQEDPESFRSPRWIQTFMSRGIVNLGLCCCCEKSRQYIYSHDDILNMMQAVEMATAHLNEFTPFPDCPDSQLKMTAKTIHDVSEAMHMLHERSRLNVPNEEEEEDEDYDDEGSQLSREPGNIRQLSVRRG